MTVDPQTSSYDPRPLIKYLAALKVPYFYEEQGLCMCACMRACVVCIVLIHMHSHVYMHALDYPLSLH